MGFGDQLGPHFLDDRDQEVLRITEGLVLAAPVVGTYMSFFIFGGQFPGDEFVSRFYTVHVLLIPGILLGLITVHLILVVYHKHTQFPGPGRTEKNVVGYPLLPVYAAKAGGFFFVVFGVLAVMGALLQINPVWLYGPYNPAEVKREHHLLDRPRNQPTRTGIGVAIIVFYGILWLNSGNDLIATHFHSSINTITWICRFAIFLGPLAAFWLTRRIALSLQRSDQDRLLHGLETGVIVRSPDGEYVERHAPISKYEAYTLTAHERQTPIELGTDHNGIPAPHRIRARLRSKLSRFYFADTVQKPTSNELERRDRHDSNA